ncbi:hypothetical protein A9K55_001950 [Cordyceps militaris]|uniref:Uncharacterized protein n=1 Tax=Cordyceps militaris TaxID=73501 RepID=A0A2H4SSG1_CORMI|nr:hypothetical protein A9K55_001950 [Cordyceps militaris]
MAAVAHAFMRTLRGRAASPPPSSRPASPNPPLPSSARPSADSYDRPLTVAVAAIGLIAASHHTWLFCQSLIRTPRTAASPLHALRTALQSLKLTAQLSYKWLRRVESVSRLPFADRPRLVDVDAVLVLLAEAAESVSDAGDLLAAVVDAAAAAVPVADVLPVYAPALVAASERIGRVEHLLSKLLTILQISSVAEATSARATIDVALPLLLSANTPLARALAEMPDHLCALALVPAARLAAVRDRPPPSYSAPAGRPEAEALPDYSAATASDAPHPDGSVTIRPAGWWSVFASLTLADVCVLALLPLPLCAADLRYAECYTEAYASRVGPLLADVMEGPAKAKAAQLAAIFGSCREGGQGGVTDEEDFARRVGLEMDNRTTRDGRPRLRPQPNLIIGGP